MSYFFTSDIHFFHKNIVKFTDRGQFTTTEDHNEWVVDLWNRQVRPDDIVYSLGDFAFRNKNQVTHVTDIVERLNGRIRMIKGNHCPRELYHQLLKTEVGKRKVEYFRDYEEFRHDKHLIVMCHYPFETWRDSHRGSFHIHGHEHGNVPSVGKRLDVGLDSAYNYFGEHRLFTIEDIFNICGKLEIHDPATRYRRGRIEHGKHGE